MRELGQRIQDNRIAMNLTQAQMAERSVIALRTVVRSENGSLRQERYRRIVIEAYQAMQKRYQQIYSVHWAEDAGAVPVSSRIDVQ